MTTCTACTTAPATGTLFQDCESGTVALCTECMEEGLCGYCREAGTFEWEPLA